MAQVINNHQHYSYKKQNQKKSTSTISNKIDLKSHTIQQLYNIAQQAYLKNKHQKSNSQSRWNQMFAKAGTKKDKISALSSMIIQSPQTSLQSLDLLIQWTLDDNSSFALTASQALADIYIQNILVEKPSLKIFVDLVQGYIKSHKKNSQVQSAQLIGFYLQHKIKHFYSQFIRSLQQLLQKNVNYVKKGAINILVKLTKFQQLRRNIIGIVVNKFGQSQKQIVNQVSKSLKNQFYQDLTSSSILLQQAQAFLFRKNLQVNTQFYVINFLNSLNLKFLNQSSLAKLFQIFYYFFNKMIDKQNQQSNSSRLFLNSVKGLNKIMSFLKTGSKQTRNMIQQKTEAVYKIVHTTTNTKAKVQLLLFLFQSHSHLNGSLPDRYYRVLYDFLSHDDILNCSLVEVFFDLLLVSIKQDENLKRVLAFLKRLLQLCFKAPVNFIVTCLIMVSKIIEENQSLKIALFRKQNWLEGELKQEQQLNENNQINNKESDKYDMFKREPIYAGAQKTCLWQIRAFCNHFHPTVRKYANNILNGQNISYDGSNPLLQFNLTSFIQKFSLKKQKKSQSWRIKMKKNLPKIRASKYQSMLQKSLQNYRQDEQFIKKYLQRRRVIHKISQNRKRPTDIQQYADDFMERQMDRLNPDKDLDISFSDNPEQQDQQDMEDDLQNFNDQQFDNQADNDEQQLADQQDKQQFDEDIDDEGEGQFDQQIDNDQENGIYQDNMEQQNSEQQQQDSQSADREFEDAFDDIGSDQQINYPKKNKKIEKNGRKPNYNSTHKKDKKNKTNDKKFSKKGQTNKTFNKSKGKRR